MAVSIFSLCPLSQTLSIHMDFFTQTPSQGVDYVVTTPGIVQDHAARVLKEKKKKQGPAITTATTVSGGSFATQEGLDMRLRARQLLYFMSQSLSRRMGDEPYADDDDGGSAAGFRAKVKAVRGAIDEIPQGYMR
jgi:hypothetical protein